METPFIVSGICGCSRSATPGTCTRAWPRSAAGDIRGRSELFGAGNSGDVTLLSAAGSSRDCLRVTSDEPPWPRRYRGRSSCFREGAHLVLDHLCSRGDLEYHFQYHGRAHDSAATAILKTDSEKLLETASPPPIATTGSRVRIFYWSLAACGAIGAALVLYFFAPEQHGFYPRCLFHAVTGLQCPGCGGLRAAHRLLHGDVAGAWRFNPLVIIAIPLVGAWSIAWLLPLIRGLPQPRFLKQSTWGWAIAAVAILFAIARNWPR